uniref:Uncharacterized protein n=1 Tax=Globodera rostochiensis TaxID=31243 RepID=A0A914H6E0_GLORO
MLTIRLGRSWLGRSWLGTELARDGVGGTELAGTEFGGTELARFARQTSSSALRLAPKMDDLYFFYSAKMAVVFIMMLSSTTLEAQRLVNILAENSMTLRKRYNST